MLEIIFLIRFTGAIGENLRKKGYSPGGHKFLAVILWFGSEIAGMLLGSALDMGVGTYVVALGLAVISAIIFWQIVSNKPSLCAFETAIVAI